MATGFDFVNLDGGIAGVVGSAYVNNEVKS